MNQAPNPEPRRVLWTDRVDSYLEFVDAPTVQCTSEPVVHSGNGKRRPLLTDHVDKVLEFRDSPMEITPDAGKKTVSLFVDTVDRIAEFID